MLVTYLRREASIEDQVEVCRRCASAQGWTIVEIYTDAAVSGASRFRPGFQNLISVLSKNTFDIVICEAIDRLSRRLPDTSDLQDQLAFYKIKLFTPSLGEITTIHIAVNGMMAQMALKDLGEKTKRGQAHLNFGNARKRPISGSSMTPLAARQRSARLNPCCTDTTRGIRLETSDNPLNRTHRNRFLLSGLIRCGCCGGDYTIINKNRFSCSTRKHKGTCENAHSITVQEIEDRALVGLKERLMDLELISAFVVGYQEAIKEERKQARAAQAHLEKRKAEIDRKIAGIFKAIEDGLHECSVKDLLDKLKTQREALSPETASPEAGRH